MPFGQIIVGCSGAGKSTYVSAMSDYCCRTGRKCKIVNLDPAAASQVPQSDNCTLLDIQNLICLDKVMNELELGPNGGLIYCMNYIVENKDWLKQEIEKDENFKECYYFFDCPGQIELYTNYDIMVQLIQYLSKELNFRLTCVNMVDSLYCSNPFHFLSILMMSLSVMIRLELPHINVLSKIDLLEKSDLQLDLDFYTQVQDLHYLIYGLEAVSKDSKYVNLCKALASVVENYSLVSFTTCSVLQVETLIKVLKWCDKANGYYFGALHLWNESIFNVAARNHEEMEE